MDCLDCITKIRKGQHLSYEERIIIELRLKESWNVNKIAKELNRSYNAIKKEIKRGTIKLKKSQRYRAKVGQMAYERNRKNSVRKMKIGECKEFIEYVEKEVREEKWSLEACVGKAIKSGEFTRKEIVCSKTLYNYVDKGLIDIKNMICQKNLEEHTRKDE